MTIKEELNKLKEEVHELKILLKDHQEIGGLIREFLLIEEQQDRVIDSMIDKKRGK
jgi:hypothetical protein